MKTQATDFGFDVLVTFLLPGLLIAISIGMFVDWQVGQMDKVFVWMKEAQFISAFLILGVVALLGTIVASIQALFESLVLDRLTPKLMSITEETFKDDWEKYIRDLDKYRNTYVTRVVLFFQFETRLGLSIIFFGISLCSWSAGYALLSGVVGVIFYAIGIFHHKELGEYRRSLFSGD